MSRVCPPAAATFCSAFLPWLLSWPLYQGHAAADLVAWSGMIFNGLVNNVLPLALALAATGVVKSTTADQLLLPPHASSVEPIPLGLTRFRPHVIAALMCVALPAIVYATALKTLDQIGGSR